MADLVGQYNDRKAGAVPAKYIDLEDGTYALRAAVVMYSWNGSAWVKYQPSAGGGGGGGVVEQGGKDATAVPWEVEVTNASIPVTGTFWQATQPVSGTFWQATQPVSGTVAVSNFPASQAVTGTFWQATQPVSGTVTIQDGGNVITIDALNLDIRDLAFATDKVDASGSAVTISGSVAVTGTFWQATQPVSGTFWQSTQPVSVAIVPTPSGDDSVADGRQTVATAGTRVQLSAQTCKVVAITAETDNTGVIVIGAVTCVAALATRRGVPLSAGDTLIMAVDNMSRLYMDSTVSTDGITWVILE